MADKLAGRIRRDVLNVADEEGRPGVPHVRTVDDPVELELSRNQIYRARWKIFLPTIAIALMYLGSWLYLSAMGMERSAISRLIVIVMAIGVPALAAHAFLRYQTIRVQVLADGLRYHPGWPRDLPIDLPYDLVERARVKYGLLGRLFGTGTLVLELTTGSRVAIADLDQPRQILDAVNTAMNASAEGEPEALPAIA